MNTKPHLILVSLICFLLVSASAQEKTKKCQRATTDSKKLTGTIKLNERESIEIAGQATYTITALNYDKSLSGEFIFVLADTERQKIAQGLKKPLENIPSTFSWKEAIAQFHKQTECPVLRFDFPAMGLGIAGTKIRFKRFTLDIKESRDKPVVMLCGVAYRIQRGRPVHRYYLINKLLNCEEDDN